MMMMMSVCCCCCVQWWIFSCWCQRICVFCLPLPASGFLPPSCSLPFVPVRWIFGIVANSPASRWPRLVRESQSRSVLFGYDHCRKCVWQNIWNYLRRLRWIFRSFRESWPGQTAWYAVLSWTTNTNRCPVVRLESRMFATDWPNPIVRHWEKRKKESK